ncbi:MAG: YueI family protein [Cetobacterium sp.]|nr:YueI family protein [Cetobacterium sp.]
MERELIDEQEKARQKFFKTQLEKNYYLGEFKENIIIALTKDQIEDQLISEEVIEAMKEPDAVLLKMRRDIPLKFFKPYIKVAEDLKLRYRLVDGVTFLGEVGLVVVSEDALDNGNLDVILESIGEKFLKAGLSEGFAYAMGKKICKKHYRELEKKLPSFVGNFKKFNILDILLGRECPIDKFDKEKGKK